MEKRLFLAIGLSLLVVWLWSAGSPKNLSPILKSTEDIEKEELVIDSGKKSSDLDLLSMKKDDLVSPETPIKQVRELSSDKLTIEVSNIGAGIDKITINEYSAVLPLEKMMTVSGYENVPFVLINSGPEELVYKYDREDLSVIKRYSIDKESYIIEVGTEIQNKTNMSKLVSVNTINYLIEMSSLDDKSGVTESRDKSLNEYVLNTESGFHRKGGAFKFSQKEKKEVAEKVLWSGFRNRYFCAIVRPEYETTKYAINPIDDKSLKIETSSQEVSVPSEGSAHFNSIIYAGPEKTEILQMYGHGFEKIKRYYRFGLFDGIAMIIEGLMRLIHRVIPNWGVSIIIISVIIYFSMYPLTMRGMLSMKKMQALQPMIAKLKEKHKDNPQKMNKEMMELYKEHKVNPLGGCLPMLLQMPVFIGLYQVLWRSVSFKGAEFLWIKDLSEPDRLFIFPFTLPVIGNELNILPLIMVLVMFFQQKLTSKNMVMSDPSQAAQQKMMTIIMPIFLGFIFYKFASGLTLYFTMFYFFSTFTQWKMSKQGKKAA